MTAKDYLSQIKILDIRIKHKLDELDDLRLMATATGSVSTDKVNIISSPRQDGLENKVIRVVELSEEIDKDIDKYVEKKHKIIEQIGELDKEKHIQLLYDRYVKYLKFEQISINLGYDYTYCRQIHAEALKSFAEKYGLENNDADG